MTMNSCGSNTAARARWSLYSRPAIGIREMSRVVIRRLAGSTSNSASDVRTITSAIGTPLTRGPKTVRSRLSAARPRGWRARRRPAGVAVQRPAVGGEVLALVRLASAAERLQLGQFVHRGQLLDREPQELGEVAALVADLHYEARCTIPASVR